MDVLNNTDIFARLCKAEQKWGLYISIYIPEELFSPGSSLKEHMVPALPFLEMDKEEWHPRVAQILCDQEGFFLFDTEEEMLQVYEQCVGDEGPTKANLYSGPVSVYALTCNPNGQLLNENT